VVHGELVWSAGAQMQITDYRFRISDFGFQIISDYRLFQITDYFRLQISDYR
jgi:hypothetical protein